MGLNVGFVDGSFVGCSTGCKVVGLFVGLKVLG